jgi:hypothetical protein
MFYLFIEDKINKFIFIYYFNSLPDQLVKLKANVTPKNTEFTGNFFFMFYSSPSTIINMLLLGLFLAHIFKAKLITQAPHNLFIHLIPETDKQNIFLAEILSSMNEILVFYFFSNFVPVLIL